MNESNRMNESNERISDESDESDESDDRTTDPTRGRIAFSSLSRDDATTRRDDATRRSSGDGAFVAFLAFVARHRERHRASVHPVRTH